MSADNKQKAACSAYKTANVIGLVLIVFIALCFLLILKELLDHVLVWTPKINSLPQQPNVVLSHVTEDVGRKNESKITPIGLNATIDPYKEAKETYFKLGKTKKEFHQYPFMLNGAGICRRHEHPFLVVMVLSVHFHIDTREAIRKTWGSIRKTGTWPGVGKVEPQVKLVFLFGRGNSIFKNKIIEHESEIYGDIVQADFVDSYFNLTRKTLMGIHWVSLYCPNAKYILKADEDVFVHIPNLIRGIQNRTIGDKGIMFGHTHEDSDVRRTGRWAVTKEMFPFDFYPTYACGNTYVISGNIAGLIFEKSEYMPYMNIEDVFVTGIIRVIIGAPIVDSVGYTYWFEGKPKPCEFQNSIRISATKVDNDVRYEIWKTLGENVEDCYALAPKKPKEIIRRPTKHAVDHSFFRDDHIMWNKTGHQFFVIR